MNGPAPPPSDWHKPQIIAVPWQRAQLTDDARTVRLIYVTAPELDLVGAKAVRGESVLEITLYEQHPPAVWPDGLTGAVSLAAHVKCVDLRLTEPTSGLRLIDGAPPDRLPTERPDPYVAATAAFPPDGDSCPSFAALESRRS